MLLLEASFSGNTLLKTHLIIPIPVIVTFLLFLGGGGIGNLSICGQVNATCFDNFITNLQDTPIDKGNANVTLDPEAEVKVLFRLFSDNMRKGCPKIVSLQFFLKIVQIVSAFARPCEYC